MDKKIDQASLAMNIAMRVHAGQRDLGGHAYIGHIARVAAKIPAHDIEGQALAFLHDVVEDGGISLDDLVSEGVEPRIVAAVDAISRREREIYEDYVVRLSKDPIALRVKLADLSDNLNLSRLQAPLQASDYKRAAKYARAAAFLLSVEQDEINKVRADIKYDSLKNSGQIRAMEDRRALVEQINVLQYQEGL
jgi:(p)ppGpp synthase/HD superfamily hydrolase